MWKPIARKVATRVVKKLSAAAGVTAPVVGGPSPAVRDDPGKLADRTYIAARGTRWERIAFHRLAARIKHCAIDERRRLGAQYLETHAGAPDAARASIDRVTGLGSANLSDSPIVQAAIEEAHRIIATKDPAAC